MKINKHHASNNKLDLSKNEPVKNKPTLFSRQREEIERRINALEERINNLSIIDIRMEKLLHTSVKSNKKH